LPFSFAFGWKRKGLLLETEGEQKNRVGTNALKHFAPGNDDPSGWSLEKRRREGSVEEEEGRRELLQGRLRAGRYEAIVQH
jgi:hypothetical protein